MVAASENSAPSPFGHQLGWIAPFGKYTKAMRNGLPLALEATGAAPAAAISRAGRKDSNAGKASPTPRPRRKFRRLKPASCPEDVFQEDRDLVFIVWPVCPPPGARCCPH